MADSWRRAAVYKGGTSERAELRDLVTQVMTSKPGADESKWLEAFSDPLAQIYTFSAGIALADLNGDGDHKLILADLGTGKYNMTLKVYKGVTLFKENALIDLPTAVVTFFSDETDPKVPAVAVASGASVFIYKNLRPYYKFNLPTMDISSAEKEIWKQVTDSQLDMTTLTELLESLRNQLTIGGLTPRSQRFLVLREAEERREFVETYAKEELTKPTTVTCLTTMKKSSKEPESVDCIIVGAENGHIYIVDSEAFTILATASVPSPPAFLHASGLFDVEYRILVCSRYGFVYTIKRDSKHVSKHTVELNSHCVGMTKVGKNIMIGCMDQTLRAYTLKGRKQWSMKMPAGITVVETMEYTPKNYSACLVGLENKEVQIYQGVFMVDLIKLDDVVSGIKFGRFGREEGALILTLRSGGIQVKMFKRSAKLEEKSEAPGPPSAQAQKLNIPKKTKIFVDQTMREREQAQKMHQSFQRDLFMLRLNVAREYSKMLETNLNPMTLDSSSDKMLSLSARVQGFGPLFLMKIYLQTTSLQAATDLSITFQYNPRLYSVSNNIIPCGMLVPGLEYSFDTKVKCLLPEKGLSDDIKVFVVNEESTSPTLTAVITMPVSEMSLLD